MQVTINGRNEEVQEHITVQTLLETYGLKPAITVVEKNEVILKQDDYGAVMVEAGDRIELIRYMGGG